MGYGRPWSSERLPPWVCWVGRTATSFLPTVRQATSRVGLLRKYRDVAGQAVAFGLVRPEDASIGHYVTRKALDGLAS